MKVSVCRKAHFNAAHRLYNPAWDMAKNDTILANVIIQIFTVTITVLKFG